MPPQNQPPEYQSPEQLPAADYAIPSQDRLQGQAPVSRRSLLRGGLVGGGIGLVVAGGAGAAVAITRNSSDASLKPVSKPVVMAPMASTAMRGPLVMYISDTTNGVIDVFAGTGATQIHNPALVAQLLGNLK
ncbi:MAG TPA: hypothetical protein VMG38_08925 [Trebonia sp.]|nr:hypothetical protein [Trebonia sp.]